VLKIIIAALITNRNKPKLNIVTGSVRTTKTGLIIAFSKLNTNANSNEVTIPP
jgi:hypothetical protein